VGIAGSSKLGNYVTLGGQVGIAGHLKIGNQAIVAAKSGVMRDIKDGKRCLATRRSRTGRPKRQIVSLRQLPDMMRRLRDLEKKPGMVTGQEPEGSIDSSGAAKYFRFLIDRRECFCRHDRPLPHGEKSDGKSFGKKWERIAFTRDNQVRRASHGPFQDLRCAGGPAA